jgi:predicted AlkP superfamily phosphohydrolase/phosphomutase
MVSCFLTPGGDAPYTFPRSLARELEASFGAYEPDVPEFRTTELDRVRRDLFRTTAQHFDIARHLWTERRPDFLMMVEIGTDRLHHAFWTHLDPEHPRHDPASPHREVGEAYYRYVDERIGELLSLAGEDTDVLVVSDHGARPMLGGMAINEWLLREGYLTLERPPREPATPASLGVDWRHTRAVGEGGYYARVFLNVEGRDPNGVIPASRYEEEREALARRLERMPGPDGAPLVNRVDRPEAVYRRVRGRAPDLLVYFGDLAYRSLGTVGHGRVWLEANDAGPDGANHDWDGIVIAAGPSVPRRGRVEGARLYDVLPTALACLGVDCPKGLLGESLLRPDPEG